ncbi:hypothetical protein Leef1_48 [Polaribacter phage Leef_1]|uniref:Terminase large subunit n=1 Tax=Polaribacter phage Leef_1 TaxID=2745684 RepID=A0A8E4ZM51_9CAUD|nr:hypothetical protein M1M28_gp48 [Polaribacter phage Leef_1]QQV91414.1 hypothetical protein Leef1_48 [Polaribacter phage Leef_1]
MKKQIKLNLAQLVAVLAKQKIKYLEWGRGTGKSTILAYFMIMMCKYMPRATFILVGNTYAQILSNTLKSTKKGLTFFGIYEGVDYIVGSSEGKKMGYRLPYETPNQWNNIIHFSNGTVFQLVGLDSPNSSNSGRGINSSGFLVDEAALIDQEKLAVNVKNTNRAVAETIYGDNPFMFSETYISSTPVTKKGKWFTEAEKLMIEKPNEYFFHSATAHWNLDNVRPDYFEYMKEGYGNNTVLYKAEMLNIRPKEITDGYYSQLNPDIHYYTKKDNSYLESIDLMKLDGSSFNCKQDADLDTTQPLLISVDWGANINTLTVSQLQEREYKVLKEFYVKSPKILDHLFIEEFIPYYASYPNKTIRFYGDRSGNSRVANSKFTFAEQAAKILRDAGWKVTLMTVGNNPSYMDKFRLINVMLREDGRGRLPKIRINSANCPNLIISLELAEIIDTSSGLKKDKRSEQRKSVEQQHATHFSDTFDYPIYSMFSELFSNQLKTSEDLPNMKL